MDTQPWDYWVYGENGATTPKGRAGEILALLEGVLKTNPDHPGAIHYYIHAVEASDTPERAEPYADRLAALMPGAGHIVHMPSHIYYRVGRYLDSLKANQDAVVVDEAFFAKVDDQGIYRGGYYTHNVHFVAVSAQMAGDGKTAVAAAEKLAGLVTDEAASSYAWAQPIKAAPYFTHAQYSAPDTVLALPDPGDKFAYVKGMLALRPRRGGGGEGRCGCGGGRGRRHRRTRHQGRPEVPARQLHPRRPAAADRPPRGAGPHCPAPGRPRQGRRGIRAGGDARGRPTLYGAALLVLPGPSVAGRRAAAGRAGRRRRSPRSRAASSWRPITAGPSTA